MVTIYGCKKDMNKKHSILLIIILTTSVATPLRAQWILQFQNAAGYALFRDQGVSPLSYHGASTAPALNLVFTPHASKGWQFSLQTQAAIGGYEDAATPLFNFSTIGGHAQLRIKATHLLPYPITDTPSPWSFRVGASTDNQLWMSYNPNLENASFGLSDFLTIRIHSRAELRFGRKSYNADSSTVTHGRWLAHGEIAIAPIALVYRPGYAYLDNYNSNEEGVIHTVLTSYTWSATPLSAIESDIGVTRLLHNGNRVGLAYRWYYLSSGNACYSRFEQAAHLLVISLDFQL